MKGLVGRLGRLDMDRVLEGACAALNWNVATLKKKGRVHGEDRQNRDLLVFLLWETGAYTKAEIGEIFGIGYTTVSHIARRVKEQIPENQIVEEKYHRLKSQSKMWPPLY